MKYIIIEGIFVCSYTCSCASDKMVWREKFYIGPSLHHQINARFSLSYPHWNFLLLYLDI
jgi:hypothetical protein